MDDENESVKKRKGSNLKSRLSRGYGEYSKSDDSFNSYVEDSDTIDEEKLMSMRTNALDNAKFSVYNKYLNVLLLKTGDPFVA